MATDTSHSFFTPDEFCCQQHALPGSTYKQAQLLLNRSAANHVFVPIRSMQYLAIIEAAAFWFVDSLAYAVRGNEGGRMITVSWHPVEKARERVSLEQNMECRIVLYGKDLDEVQLRLCTEFHLAMVLLDERYREQNIPAEGARILPFKL